MARPADMSPAEAFAHGTRARYTSGCRCADCKRANLDYYHQRQARKREAASTVKPSGPAGEGVIVRAGVAHKVCTCPGANGAPCVRTPPAWLRGTHDVCGACVERVTVWNGTVPVGPVRAHLLELSRAGVGYKSVADACDVPSSIVAKALRGEGTIRASTAKRILDVDAGAIADSALVDAAPTWTLIRRLLREGFTKGELALRLGYQTRALQIGRRRVLASTAAKVRRFFNLIMAGGEDLEPKEAA